MSTGLQAQAIRFQDHNGRLAVWLRVIRTASPLVTVLDETVELGRMDAESWRAVDAVELLDRYGFTVTAPYPEGWISDQVGGHYTTAVQCKDVKVAG